MCSHVGRRKVDARPTRNAFGDFCPAAIILRNLRPLWSASRRPPGPARSLPPSQLDEIKGRVFNHQSAVAELADKENAGHELQQAEASADAARAV